MNDVNAEPRVRIDVRERKPAMRRVTRAVLYAGWAMLGVLLWVFAPPMLSALELGLGWLLGLIWVGIAVAAWSSPARFGGVPVRLVLAGVAAAFLVLAALETYAAVT